MNIPDGKESDLKQAAAVVYGWRRPLLITHAKPDGDALGSLVAVQRLLASRDAAPLAVIFEPLPDRLRVFDRLGSLSVLSAGGIHADCTKDDLSRCDGVVILDTCTYNQLEPLADWLRSAKQPKLVVDHHITRDPVPDHYLIDESAAATCLILFDWARAAGWAIDTRTAAALFIGVATDTGWFRHSNTDARALKAAGELTELGACPNELFLELYQRDSASRIRLLGAALNSLELHCEDRLAVMQLPLSVYAKTGAVHADTEDIVNEPLRIESALVSVLLVEQSDGQIRINLRSKAPPAGGPDVDVAAIAQLFGGGGHKRAAGARLRGGVDEVARKLIDKLTALLI